MDNSCDNIDGYIHPSLASELSRLARYVATAVGGYLVAQGYASQEVVELATGIIVTATPIVTGMIIGRTQRKHVATVIDSLKNSKSNGE